MSKLYIIPTPLGNLKDITFRAVETLKEMDLILAEDTRTSSKLLRHYEIENKLRSFHQHNEHKVLEGVVEELKGGSTIGLISDAGTPGISDPGFLLVRECVREGIDVETLPGATAFVPALVNSGLPCDRFVFEGFLPHKKGRQTRLINLQEEERTIVFYESPHRLLKTLKQFVEFFEAGRQVSVSRELTKIHEENVQGTLEEVIAHFEKRGTVKGELVVVLAGKA